MKQHKKIRISFIFIMILFFVILFISMEKCSSFFNSHKITGINMYKLPDKTVYIIGEDTALDLTGMIIEEMIGKDKFLVTNSTTTSMAEKYPVTTKPYTVLQQTTRQYIEADGEHSYSRYEIIYDIDFTRASEYEVIITLGKFSCSFFITVVYPS